MRRGLPLPVLRTFVLAAVAVVASTYALVRYYTHPRPPMLVPAPPPSESSSPGEIPVPDFEDAGP